MFPNRISKIFTIQLNAGSNRNISIIDRTIDINLKNNYSESNS